MGNSEVLLRYDGPALADHSMDVSDFAPALLSFGNLCKEANRVINGNKASIKVLVNADIQANCVTISLSVVQTFMESVRSLIHNGDVQDAKTILEWIGLIGGPTSLGLFQFLKLKGPRKIESSTEIVDNDGANHIEVRFSGDNNTVVISPEVKKLSDTYEVIRNAKGVVSPVAERQGVETVEFAVENFPHEKIEKNDAKAIASVSIDEELEPQTIVGHITVHQVIFDNRARKWKFHYNGHVEEIDISDTNIADNIIKRRKAVLGDTYKVKMEVTERRDKSGNFKYDYKVIEVLDFIAGKEQVEIDYDKKADTES